VIVGMVCFCKLSGGARTFLGEIEGLVGGE